MSVTVTKADGVTVFTMTSDPQSPWPPLCQILKGLCYNPVCCSVSQRLRRVQTSQSVLGALQIMIGLLNIGFGAILCASRGGSSWEMDFTWFPFWLGGLFMLFGTMNILSEKYSSPCLVILNAILNLAGVAFAITAIVLYSINIADIYFWWMCNDGYYDYTTPSPSSEVIILKEKCLEGKALVLMLTRSINAVLIVLSTLELCIVISSAVLGIKALSSIMKGEIKSIDEPEYYKPLLEEVTSNPTA
ncbi:membrane-spanning 4-domains subfamily A member 8-like [Siniperca chuatsi]|uniref:membrane-spanning 4-domains subfamily A member 8-like n=1 Tax=Siniperca chuatsi TaxID=119488 RepID=UPI001CE1DEC5|nr:membrane-spanning 4-domains subfamily A member 8-like [Siniperca chuatsi]XP_044063817.1 membrane-spanning 4-domains subfamily A member 8-like [Siniperca chuatsi]